MHRFLHKIVTQTHYTKLTPSGIGNTHRAFHSHAHKSFSSLLKPSHSQTPHNISGSFVSHPLHHFRFHLHSWPLGHTLCGKFRGFLSDPVFARHFMLNSSNALLRVSSRGLGGCRPKLLKAQFHRQSFDFNRSSRWLGGGWRSWFQRLTSNEVVLGLIIANTVVFLSWRIADAKFMSDNFTISLHNLKCGRLHTLITNAFSHINIEHIISNMIGLYFFGTNIGSVFGPQYLLKLYLAGAIGGSVFFLVHQVYKAQTSKGRRGVDISRQQALGASGAVNAIMLLNIFLFPKSTLYLDLFIPVPAMLLGIFLIGKDVLRIIEGDSHISGSAHLGGAAVAAIAWARLRKGRF